MVNRVGRTARAGRAGVSVSLAGEQERKMVKDIIKRARFPVKNRVIPPDIIDKYRQKVKSLEPQIAQILQEEEEERLLSKAENQANKMEKVLAGVKEPARPWFQTKQERKKEQTKLKNLAKTGKAVNGKQKKAKSSPKDDPEEQKLAKIAAVQARAAKRKFKQKKIGKVGNDTSFNGASAVKKKKSHFKDIVDTKSAKKIRYQSKFQQKNKKKK